MERRNFLRKLALGVAGLMVADDALELLVKPERKIFPVGIDLGWSDMGDPDGREWYIRHYEQRFVTRRPSTVADISRVIHEVYADGIRNHLTTLHPLLRQFS